MGAEPRKPMSIKRAVLTPCAEAAMSEPMTKTALITGASRGLGHALALALAPTHHIIAVARPFWHKQNAVNVPLKMVQRPEPRHAFHQKMAEVHPQHAAPKPGPLAQGQVS